MEANGSTLVMDNNDDVKAIEAMGKHILGQLLDLFILAALGVGYLYYLSGGQRAEPTLA